MKSDKIGFNIMAGWHEICNIIQEIKQNISNYIQLLTRACQLCGPETNLKTQNWKILLVLVNNIGLNIQLRLQQASGS